MRRCTSTGFLTYGDVFLTFGHCYGLRPRNDNADDAFARGETTKQSQRAKYVTELMQDSNKLALRRGIHPGPNTGPGTPDSLNHTAESALYAQNSPHMVHVS